MSVTGRQRGRGRGDPASPGPPTVGDTVQRLLTDQRAAAAHCAAPSGFPQFPPFIDPSFVVPEASLPLGWSRFQNIGLPQTERTLFCLLLANIIGLNKGPSRIRYLFHTRSFYVDDI